MRLISFPPRALASISACSMRSTWPGSSPPSSLAGRQPACWTPITTNATSPARGHCCKPRRRWHCGADRTRPPKRSGNSSGNCSPTNSHCAASEPSSPAPASATRCPAPATTPWPVPSHPTSPCTPARASPASPNSCTPRGPSCSTSPTAGISARPPGAGSLASTSTRPAPITGQPMPYWSARTPTSCGPQPPANPPAPPCPRCEERSGAGSACPGQSRTDLAHWSGDSDSGDNEAMTSGLVRCEHCGRTNRVPAAAAGTPRCGKCHEALPWIAEADDATFGEVAEAAKIPVVVDLWAPWCGPCRMVSPALEQLARDLAGKVKLVKVNVDTSPQVSQRFGVQAIPTLLVLRRGQVAARQTGAVPLAALRTWVDNALAAAG